MTFLPRFNIYISSVKSLAPTTLISLDIFFPPRQKILPTVNLPFSKTTFTKKKRIIASSLPLLPDGISLLAFVKVSPGSWTTVWNRDRSHHIWLCSWNSSNRPTLTMACVCACFFDRRVPREFLCFSFTIFLSFFLSINSQIDWMEIIHRTRYRRLQGFFLQVETGHGRDPLREREKRREITQCECNERNLHEVASKLRQILLGNTSITIPPAVAIFLGWKIVFLGVVSSLERTRRCWN